MIERPADVTLRWPLPKKDDWSTPFAEALLRHLNLIPGAKILDIACGHGIPAFYLAEQVGPAGELLAIDASPHQVARARMIQGRDLPWLRFDCLDMRAIPPSVPVFDRITGNLSVMFFRPNRFETVRGLVGHLKPGGQIVLTFPSLGTFDSLWRRIDREMEARASPRSGKRLRPTCRSAPRRKKAAGGSPRSVSKTLRRPSIPWRSPPAPARCSSTIPSFGAGFSTTSMNASKTRLLRRR